MRIREAGPADLRAVAELEGRCFSTPWPDSALRYAMEGEGCTLLAAETEKGALAGYLALQCVLDEGYINNVCTSPEQRRRGVGSALLEETLRRAQERALAFLTLEVRRSNAAAIGLYGKFGFKTVAARPNYYECPREDALIMTLYLGEGQT